MSKKVFQAEVLEKKMHTVSRKLFRFRLGVALFLDGVDFIIGWIPIINTLWDILTYFILWMITKNKKMATISLTEIPLIGVPGLAQIDQLIPIATITILADEFLSENF